MPTTTARAVSSGSERASTSNIDEDILPVETIVTFLIDVVTRLMPSVGIVLLLLAQRQQNQVKSETVQVNSLALNQEAMDRQNRFFFEQYKELTLRLDNTNSAMAAAKERASILHEQYQNDKRDLETRLSEQQKQIDKVTGERDTALEGKVQAEAKAIDMGKQLSELREQLVTANQSQATKDEAFEVRINALEEQMAAINEQLERTRKERDEFKLRAETAEALVVELQSERAVLKAEIATLKAPPGATITSADPVIIVDAEAAKS